MMPAEMIESGLTGKRIVLIEDEGVSLMAFLRICQKAGMIVVGTASNGREGVAITLKEGPDIVLTDIEMPVMDGFEAARLILERMHVCLIFITAFSDTETLERMARSGGSGCIGKPVANDVLMARLEECYRCYEAEQNH